jgi:hypothetical protein
MIAFSRLWNPLREVAKDHTGPRISTDYKISRFSSAYIKPSFCNPTPYFPFGFHISFYFLIVSMTAESKPSTDVPTFKAEIEPGRVLTMPADGTGVAVLDPWLEPFTGALRHRFALYQKYKKMIEDSAGGYEKFTKGYEYFGFHVQKDNSVVYREWAPNATGASLIGEFSKFLSS